MFVYKPTREELETLTWTNFLEKARNQFVLITIDQFADLLGRRITGITDLRTRVQQLFETKPVIGINHEGNVVIRTYGTFNADELDMTFTWLTAWYIGTVTNTNVKVTTVDINCATTSTVVRDAIYELLSITTDDLQDVPMMSYNHNLIGLTKGGFTYCDKKLNATPVPHGAKWVSGLMMLKGHGTNAMKAIDDKGLEHSGQWDTAQNTVIYDAITATETVPTTPTTGI